MPKPLRLEQEKPKKLYNQLVKGGLALLQSLPTIHATESEILDFKLSKNQGLPLDFDDKVNISKSISGFANSGGGVLVWGVYCAEDEQKIDRVIDLRPIENIRAFETAVINASSQLVEPRLQKIRYHIIPTDEFSGYLVMLIPDSKEFLIQSITKKGKGFYERVGTSFSEVSDERLIEKSQRAYLTKQKVTSMRVAGITVILVMTYIFGFFFGCITSMKAYYDSMNDYNDSTKYFQVLSTPNGSCIYHEIRRHITEDD